MYFHSVLPTVLLLTISPQWTAAQYDFGRYNSLRVLSPFFSTDSIRKLLDALTGNVPQYKPVTSTLDMNKPDIFSAQSAVPQYTKPTVVQNQEQDFFGVPQQENQRPIFYGNGQNQQAVPVFTNFLDNFLQGGQPTPQFQNFPDNNQPQNILPVNNVLPNFPDRFIPNGQGSPPTSSNVPAQPQGGVVQQQFPNRWQNPEQRPTTTNNGCNNQPHESDITRYYHTSYDGIRDILQCPRGLVFNAISCGCNRPNYGARPASDVYRNPSNNGISSFSSNRPSIPAASNNNWQPSNPISNNYDWGRPSNPAPNNYDWERPSNTNAQWPGSIPTQLSSNERPSSGHIAQVAGCNNQPHESDSSKYYHTTYDGIRNLIQCPRGLIFNAVSCGCDREY